MSVVPGMVRCMMQLSSGSLVAELRGRQWVVRDGAGETVAWIAPAAGTWSVSLFDASSGAAPGPFLDVHAALEALALRFG